MGEAESLTRAQYEALERRDRISLIRRLIPIGLMAVAEELQKEVEELVQQSLDPETGKARVIKHGSNQGSVILGNQRVPVRVPRVRGENGDISLESYDLLHNDLVPETLYKTILGGVSCKGYESTIENHSGSISKSKSTISKRFIAQSEKELQLFQNRDLSGYDFIVIFIDGKPFYKDQMIISLGITMNGEKIILGFVQAGTENTIVISHFLQSLMDRGLKIDQGILAVTDGSKGLISGLKQAFNKKVVIQRCQWHKRENVTSYLPKNEQEFMKTRLQKAYERPTLSEAEELLNSIQDELDKTNQSAASSLKEGLKETLTLHRLGLFAKIGVSLKTTNCLESINSSVEKFCGKVRYWKNSSQKQRWLASALRETEPTLRTIKGYSHLPELRTALKKELGLEG
jgi:transposase-like protein